MTFKSPRDKWPKNEDLTRPYHEVQGEEKKSKKDSQGCNKDKTAGV